MKEETGDIWKYYYYRHKFSDHYYLVLTTNGTLKKDGTSVMGRGIAYQVNKKFPEFSALLGKHILINGNVPMIQGRLITFPTKHDWWENSDINLIEESCKGLLKIVNSLKLERIAMVRPGCANGNLWWEDVKPVIEPYLDDRFTIVYGAEPKKWKTLPMKGLE